MAEGLTPSPVLLRCTCERDLDLVVREAEFELADPRELSFGFDVDILLSRVESPAVP